MAISVAWLLDKLGNKLYSWSTTKAVMDFDRGGESGQTLQKTLNDFESGFATAEQGQKADTAVQTVNGIIGPNVQLNTQVINQFGQFGAVNTGSFELYGKIIATNLPGGVWRVEFTGKVGQISGEPQIIGISLSKISGIIGKTLQYQNSYNQQFFAYPANNTTVPVGAFDYSGVLRLQTGILVPARIYTTTGEVGPWPYNTSTNIYTLTTYWMATMYFTEE